MEANVACPVHERLLAFQQGKLDAEHLEAIGQHAANCPRCLSVLATLADDSDSIVTNLRGGPPAVPWVQDPAIERIVARARAILVGPEGEHGNTGQDQDRARAMTVQGPLPAMLGFYQLLRPLGRGGMGVVYEAVHTLLKKRVAIKLLPPGRVNEAQAVARFHREMEALGELSHPNIVCATDAGEADGHHYLVMECVDGLDLSALTSRHGPLALADAAEVIRQAAIGLQYVHEHDRVHRDIKPANLMISIQGELKILDLGLALLRAERPLEEELTSDGQAMGTADYTAPEQWLDSHRVDIRADIYSLGCSLYKLLAGRAPFSGPRYDTRLKKRTAHIEAAVPPIDNRHDLSGALLGHLARMLAKEPDQRFTTPASVAEAMAPFTAGCDLRALVRTAHRTPSNDSAPGRPAPSAADAPVRRRLRWPAWAYALLAVVLVAAGGAVVAMRMHEPEARPPVTPTTGWRSIAADAPQLLQWPRDPRNSRWQWNAQQAELHVTCSEDGYIRLGEAARDHYQFEVAIYQTAWGNAGIFFGYQPETLHGKPCHRFQRILLRRSEDPGGPRGYYLAWFVTHAWSDGGSTSSEPVTAPLPEFGDQDQHLTIAVEAGILHSVRWNGVELMPRFLDSSAVKHATGQVAIDCRGTFGVHVGRTNAFFRDPRYRFPGEP